MIYSSNWFFICITPLKVLKYKNDGIGRGRKFRRVAFTVNACNLWSDQIWQEVPARAQWQQRVFPVKFYQYIKCFTQKQHSMTNTVLCLSPLMTITCLKTEFKRTLTASESSRASPTCARVKTDPLKTQKCHFKIRAHDTATYLLERFIYPFKLLLSGFFSGQ